MIVIQGLNHEFVFETLFWQIDCQICGPCRWTFKQQKRIIIKCNIFSLDKMEYVHVKFILL